MVITADAQMVQVQTETRGAVPEDAVGLAMHQVSSLLRVASEPVLFARVKLTMAADPAVGWPAIAQATVDLNGRLVRAQAAGGPFPAGGNHGRGGRPGGAALIQRLESHREQPSREHLNPM